MIDRKLQWIGSEFLSVIDSPPPADECVQLTIVDPSVKNVSVFTVQATPVGVIYRFWLTFPHVNEWGLFSDLLFFYLKINPLLE